MMINLFQALFLLKYYYLSDFITQVGLSLAYIGLNWFILQVTGSSLDVGILMILGILYIEKSENCFLYLETGFLKIMMHGRECK